MTTIELVRLKNGSEEVRPAVVTTLMCFQQLNPLEKYDLVMVCRDSNYSIPFEQTLQRLKDLSLLQPDGQPHQTAKNIILSAAEGEGMEMTFGSPIAEEG